MGAAENTELEMWRERALKAEAQRDGYKAIAEGLQAALDQQMRRRCDI